MRSFIMHQGYPVEVLRLKALAPHCAACRKPVARFQVETRTEEHGQLLSLEAHCHGETHSSRLLQERLERPGTILLVGAAFGAERALTQVLAEEPSQAITLERQLHIRMMSRFAGLFPWHFGIDEALAMLAEHVRGQPWDEQELLGRVPLTMPFSLEPFREVVRAQVADEVERLGQGSAYGHVSTVRRGLAAVKLGLLDAAVLLRHATRLDVAPTSLEGLEAWRAREEEKNRICLSLPAEETLLP